MPDVVTLTSQRFEALLIGASVLLFAAIYVPQLGHGFVKDDFQWVADGRRPLSTAFTKTTGFYRPAVTLSFVFNYSVSALNPFAYGLTNFLLAVCCAVGVGALAKTVGLTSSAALVAALMWSFNFHGVNVAILWISGRTALFLTLSSILAALAFLHGRRALCLLGIAAALFSKEEAIFLPVILVAWSAFRGTAIRAWWVFIPVPFYLVARSSTDAMVPWDAPRYYAFTFELEAVASNLLQYMDRAWTFPVAAALCLWAISRRAPSIDLNQRRSIILGAVWFALAIAITVFLPVRSSLYACWPAVGAAIACAAVTDAWFRRVTEARSRAAVLALVVLLLALVPVYRARNVRWVEIAELSSETIDLMRTCGSRRCDRITLVDDDSTRRNFENTFSGQAAQAASLFLEHPVPVVIVSRSETLSDESTPPACLLRIELNGVSLKSHFEGVCAPWPDR